MTRYEILGFEDHALPCSRCGELVVVATRTPEDAAEVFSSEHVRIFCHDCWPLPSDDITDRG